MATATVQTVWDCRWSRAGHQITGLADALQPEPTWVCVRDGDRRAVCDGECAGCSRWEAATASADIPMGMACGAILTDRPVETSAGPTPVELAQVMVRIELVCLALVFLGIGLTVLTTPASAGFTVALWLCAATFLGLAVFGHLEG